MILIINASSLFIENIHFLETRKNMLMDGKFTKIVYSNDNIVLNGIYLSIPFKDFTYDKSYSRILLKNVKSNKDIINTICKYEAYIMKYYKHINACNKKAKYLLNEQLSSMSVKVYRDNYPNIQHININGEIALKISGIWEDDTSFGLTYKIMETFPLV